MRKVGKKEERYIYYKVKRCCGKVQCSGIWKFLMSAATQWWVIIFGAGGIQQDFCDICEVKLL